MTEPVPLIPEGASDEERAIEVEESKDLYEVLTEADPLPVVEG
jgi:hypothetical protein